MVGLDVATNYQWFSAHRQLARVAGDLLGSFTLSTKVGFFPGASSAAPAEHSLDPRRLLRAVEQAADDLGRTPDVMFLHNPERTLAGLSSAKGAERLAGACQLLDQAVDHGLTRSWGIASWNPRPVVAALARSAPEVRPTTVMVRAGLSVSEPALNAGENLANLLRVPPSRCWGMAPFGGNAADPAWRAVDLRALVPTSRPLDAALRLAFELPVVARVAVGTSNREHLHQLVDVARLPVNGAALDRYRQLVRHIDFAPEGGATGAARSAQAAR